MSRRAAPEANSAGRQAGGRAMTGRLVLVPNTLDLGTDGAPASWQAYRWVYA